MKTKKVNYNPPDNLSLGSIEVNSGVVRMHNVNANGSGFTPKVGSEL